MYRPATGTRHATTVVVACNAPAAFGGTGTRLLPEFAAQTCCGAARRCCRGIFCWTLCWLSSWLFRGSVRTPRRCIRDTTTVRALCGRTRRGAGAARLAESAASLTPSSRRAVGTRIVCGALALELRLFVQRRKERPSFVRRADVCAYPSVQTRVRCACTCKEKEGASFEFGNCIMMQHDGRHN